MEYQPTLQSQIYELDTWTDLIQSEDWKVFTKLIKNHCEYLQESCNSYLEKHEDRRAGEELAKLNDCKKLLALASSRIAELRKQTTKEGE